MHMYNMTTCRLSFEYGTVNFYLLTLHYACLLRLLLQDSEVTKYPNGAFQS
jgi:hypothetical protein